MEYGWHFRFYNQWPGILLWRDYKWHDFTLIEITGEIANYGESPPVYAEIAIALLGFHFSWIYYWERD